MSSNGEDYGDALDRAQSGGGGSADDDQDIPDDSPFAGVVDRVSGAVDAVTDAVDDATGGGGGGGSGIRERAEQVAESVSGAVGDVTGEDEQTGSRQQSESRSTAERLADASENIEDARDARLRAEAQNIANSADPALEQARRRVARRDIAQELDQQVGQDIGAGDVRVQQTDDGLRGSLRSNVQQDIARSRAVAQLDDQTSTDITADDVTVEEVDGGVQASLTEDAARTVGTRRRGLGIAGELSDPDITVQDVGREAAAVRAAGAVPEQRRGPGLSDDAPQAVREALEGQPTGPTVGGSLEEAMPTQRTVGQETIAPGALREPDTPDSLREAVAEAPETGSETVGGFRQSSAVAADTFQQDIVRPAGGILGTVAERPALEVARDAASAENTEDLAELTQPETTFGQQTAEAARGVGSVGTFALRSPATAIDIGRTGVQAGSVLEEEVSEDGASGVGDAVGRGGSAAFEAGGSVVSAAAERPVFTGASLLATGGAIGAASRVSRGAGLAAETSIQPGAVAATGAARGTIGRTATGARVLNRIPGDRIAPEEVVLGTAAGGAQRAATAGRVASRIRSGEASIELSPSPRQQDVIELGRPEGRTDTLPVREATVDDGDVVLAESAVEADRAQAATPRPPGNVEESAGGVLDALDTQAPTRIGRQESDVADVDTVSERSDDALPLRSEIEDAGGTRQFIRGEDLPGQRISDAEMPRQVQDLIADESAEARLVGRQRQRQRQRQEEQPDFTDFSQQRQDALDLRRQLQSDIDARPSRRVDEGRSRIEQSQRSTVEGDARSRLDALADARASARSASLLEEDTLLGERQAATPDSQTGVDIVPDQRSDVFADVTVDIRPQARQRTDLDTRITGRTDLPVARPEGGRGRGRDPRTDTPRFDPGTEFRARPDRPRPTVIENPFDTDQQDEEENGGLFANDELFSSGIAAADDILEPAENDTDDIDLL